MLIADNTRLSILLEARDEIRAAREAPPTTGFPMDKLAESWRRATATAAYSAIGEFDLEAFHALAPTPLTRLKAAPWSFVATDWSGTAKYYETTGTPGRFTPTPRTVEDVVWNAVSVAEAWRAVLRDDDRVAILLPSDIVPLADLVVSVCEYLQLPHVRMYPFATGISDLDRIVELWRRFRPTVLFVEPGVAMRMTRFAKQRDQLGDLKRSVRGLMLLGEVSTGALRGRLGGWWGADVFDASYGSTETGTLAATCGQDRLHLLTAVNHFEILTPEGVVEPVRGGSVGSLVVTPLNARARPLLRMDTGDDVAVEHGCPCGDPAPVVVITGRSSDDLVLRGVALTVRAVEEVVYGATSATGYLVETDAVGEHSRLLLERDVDGDRDAEPAEVAAVQRTSAERLGSRWDLVRFVNFLPNTTKTGSSGRSRKGSDIPVVEVER